MTIQETRIRALRKVIAASGMKVAELARKHDIDPSHISQLLNGHRGFGEKAARTMEEKLGIPTMSLDTEDSALDASNVSRSTEIDIRRIPVINCIQAGHWREICDTFAPTEVLMTHLELSPREPGLVIYGPHVHRAGKTERLAGHSWDWQNWLTEFSRRANLEIIGERIPPFNGVLL